MRPARSRSPGVTLDALAAAVRRGAAAPVDVVPRLDDVPARGRAHRARRATSSITLGAGSIGSGRRSAARLLTRGRALPAPPTERRMSRRRGSAGQAVPTRAREAGAPASPSRPRAAVGRRWRCCARRAGLYRGVASVAPTPACCDRPHRGRGQRAAVERRGARGARRAARREHRVDRPRRVARRLLASPWVRDAALRRSLPSTVEVVVAEREPIGIGRIGGELYLVDERGGRHRRVRAAVRRSRPADRRRPGRAEASDGRRCSTTRRARSWRRA